MPSWFRKGLSPHQTALAMIGAKPGDRVGVVGANDPDLSAEVAVVTGLNGSTVVYDEDGDAKERVEIAARKAGALVDFERAEFTRLPGSDGSLDVVVVQIDLNAAATDRRAALIKDALRMVRPGGRLVVIDGERSAGVLGALKQKRTRIDAREVLKLLTGAGTKAQRQLADVDGVAFYEARKA